jgi:hypothetical protein
MISALMVLIQGGLSVLFILAMRERGWPAAYQAAGPAAALMLALGLASILKARLLRRLLGAPVQAWRWALVWAAAVAVLVGWVFTSLPQRFEWLELGLGMPMILLTFGIIIWMKGFTQDDRALFRMGKKESLIDEGPALPPPSGAEPPIR